MKGEKLSCGAWIDHKGIVHRDREEARQFQAWKPGHFALGEDYEQKIGELIAEHADEIREKLCYDEAGNLLEQRLETFNSKIKPNLERQARNNLRQYELRCQQLRDRQHIRPFNWALETRDRIRDLILGRRQLPRMRNIDPEFLKAKYKNEYAWPGFPKCAAKPEYQDENHPLEQSQRERKANQIGISKRAKNALELYEKTGRLTVPARRHDAHIERWTIRQELRRLPKPKNAVIEAENLENVIRDVAKRLQRSLLEIEQGQWTEIGP